MTLLDIIKRRINDAARGMLFGADHALIVAMLYGAS